MITPIKQPSIVYKVQWFDKAPGKAWCLEWMLFDTKEEAEKAEREIRNHPNCKPFNEGDRADKYWTI